MGYWTITFAQEEWPLLMGRCKRRKRKCGKDSELKLAYMGKRIREVMRELGYHRGLSRWHFCGGKGRFGKREAGEDVWEWHRYADSEDGRWKPHLNIIVDGGYLGPDELERQKEAIRSVIAPGLRKWLVANGKVQVIHYEYSADTASKVYWLKYINRATLLEPTWGEGMLPMLWNFRNNAWWGKWEDSPLWSLDAPAENIGAISQLEGGFFSSVLVSSPRPPKIEMATIARLHVAKPIGIHS
ncbi:unnamed protein product [marine sediment metagenome]|uniref:Uncharacterized protein n=1 Tax=marine sediment metagenome TaxID=412755 RepID=X1LYI0_9ZZZZ